MAEVLVVDDDADVCRLMTVVLGKAGHKVATCASGTDALKNLGIEPEDPSAELPDLLVLDIMMPRPDGNTVANVIRGHPRTRELPILVISALKELRILGMTKARVDGFMVKPFDPDTLVGNVERMLDRRGAGPGPAGA